MREGSSELVAAERPRGVFSRQLILGDNLDLDQIAATYSEGVLTLTIPVAERAKPARSASTCKAIRSTIEGTSEQQAVTKLTLPTQPSLVGAPLARRPGNRLRGLWQQFAVVVPTIQIPRLDDAQRQEWSGAQ
jgi:hypothetical protein